MNSFRYRILNFFYKHYWQLIRLTWLFVPKKSYGEITQHTFSIAIVTYIDRFESHFQPFINTIVTSFSDTEIVIVINGYHDLDKQRAYLRKARLFLKNFKHVKVIDFEQAQSLSKLWNIAILNANNEKILIMNDDLKIAPWFKWSLYNSGILGQSVALINRSWSHFLISKETIKKIGWFDERFPGVGNEDEDYESRLVFNAINIKSFKIIGIHNIVFQTKDFSYGKTTEVINKKYVKANKLFFDTKWESSSVAKPGFKYVEILNLYLKQKTGMETPNFYQDGKWH